MKTRGPSDLVSPVTGERLNTYDKYRPTEPHPGPCDMACDSLQNQTGDLLELPLIPALATDPGPS